MKFILTTEAKLDVKKAVDWYEEKQKDLGKRFSKIIREEVKIIARNPEIYTHRYRNIRTATVSVFPYLIHYTLDTDNTQVIILGIIHTSLSPKKWK